MLCYTSVMTLTIGVLRGGPGTEYEVSLKTGASILKHLPGKHRTVDIFIDREGVWHRDGKAVTPLYALRDVDLVWNGLHGEYGEGGTVQGMLDSMGKRYTGSGAAASAVAMNKHLTKNVLSSFGVKSPRGMIIDRGRPIGEAARMLFEKIGFPMVVKPIAGGSSVGLFVARTMSELHDGLVSALDAAKSVLVEEYIGGKEATVGVVDGFRGQKSYSLMPVEIRIPRNKLFFDYESKYGGEVEEVCPGCFHESETKELEELARKVHEALGLRHYSRSDFIVHPTRGIYFLEVNTLPGLTEHSLIPKALGAVGSDLKQFLEHVTHIAILG
jgi:D-alanine-D-alanine ligase